MMFSILTRDGKVIRNINTIDSNKKGSALMMDSLDAAGIDQQTVLVGMWDGDTEFQWRPGYDKVAIAKAAITAGIDPETLQVVTPLSFETIWAMENPTVWQIAASGELDYMGKLNLLQRIAGPHGYSGRYCICDSTDINLLHGMRFTRIDAAVLAAEITNMELLDTQTSTWIA